MRELKRIYVGWRAGNDHERHWIVTHPQVYLRVDEEAARRDDVTSESPDQALVRKLGAVTALCLRARQSLRERVKHYGIWALRYRLHKQKGFGFRTIELDDEPARYVLVVPKGRELDEFLTARSTAENSKQAANKRG